MNNKNNLTCHFIENDSLRIDKFLVKEFNWSRTKVQNMIENNLVRVNDKVVNKQNYILKKNDLINISILEIQNNKIDDIEAYEFKLDIIYEDDDLLIVNKPSNMLVHPTSFNEQNTLVNALKFYLKNCFFYVVHRLDKNTSGLVVVAKNENTQQHLLKQFQNQSVIKKYYALVLNKFDDSLLYFKIDEPIGYSFQDKLRMKTGESKNPKSAISIVRVVEQFQNTALVEVQIITGRTHQIRVHMRHINHPVLNDPLYGANKIVSDFEQYLHSYLIGFKHPKTNEDVEFKTNLPQEFLDMIGKLRNEHY